MFNRKGRPRVGDEAQPSAEQPEEAAEAPPEEQPAADRSAGPFDITEVADTADYLDLGALLVRPVPGVSIRLDQDPQTRQVVAVTVVRGSQSMQLRAFAAPRSGGMWEDNRAAVKEQLEEGGNRVEEAESTFGTELRAIVAVPQQAGPPVTRTVRFVGVEGPRWLLHAVFTAEGGRHPTWDDLEAVLGGVVVVRGEQAVPAGGMLMLRIPAEAASAAEGRPAEQGPDVESLEPGPHITEVR